MFPYTKMFLSIPLAIMAELGEPFKYENSYTNMSPLAIKEEYNKAWWKHYADRIWWACWSSATIIGLSFWAYVHIVSFLVVLSTIMLIFIVVDMIMFGSKFAYALYKERENELLYGDENRSLVTIDQLKDTDLRKVLEKHRADKKQEEEQKQARITEHQIQRIREEQDRKYNQGWQPN